MKKGLLFILAFCVGMIGMQAVFATNEQPTENVLDNTSRNLVSFDENEATGTLEFSEGKMFSRFCNNVSQPYTADETKIYSTGPAISTLMYCEGVMDMEYVFRMSEDGSAYTVSGENLTITIKNTDQDTEDSAKIHTFVFEKAPQKIGGDVDAHGCKNSAGYTWSQSQQACVRVWESTGTDTEKAYDFAYLNGITTMDTFAKFRATDKITRQEAAKMFVATATNVFDIKDTATAECDTEYKDQASFDPTLKNAIYDACVLGLMKGSQGNFMPHDTLTKGQTLAVLMRAIDGWQKEGDGATRWMPYVNRASELNYLTFDNTDELNTTITRGEIVEWIYTITQKHSIASPVVELQ